MADPVFVLAVPAGVVPVEGAVVRCAVVVVAGGEVVVPEVRWAMRGHCPKNDHLLKLLVTTV